MSQCVLRQPWAVLAIGALAVWAPPAFASTPAPPCSPSTAPAAALRDDVPAQVVFGRSVTVTADVGPAAAAPRLELVTAAGRLLTVSTRVAADARGRLVRIFDFPAPRGGTASLSARLSVDVGTGDTACRQVTSATIRLVPGRLGRLRIDPAPDGASVTVRTAAGEGCQDYLRASRIRVTLIDLSGPPHTTEVLESRHPCDGWTMSGGARSPRIRIEATDSTLELCPPRRPGRGSFRLLVTRSGRTVASGRLDVSTTAGAARPAAGAGAHATYTPDAGGGR